MDDKWKIKIQKLLALAQSDNPHEAQRAKVQAEALMRRHNLSEDELEFVAIECKRTISRREAKASECLLLFALEYISGAFHIAKIKIYPQVDEQGNRGQNKYELVPTFHGFKPDAELAAYSWDVLLDQLQKRQHELKTEFPSACGHLSAQDLEDYAVTWVCACSDKLESVFGHRELTPEVKRYMAEMQKKTKARQSTKKIPPEGNMAMATLGAHEGASAQLFTATNETKRHRIENKNGE